MYGEMYMNHFEEEHVHESMVDQFDGIDLGSDSDTELVAEYGAELGPDFSSIGDSPKKKKGNR